MSENLTKLHLSVSELKDKLSKILLLSENKSQNMGRDVY